MATTSVGSRSANSKSSGAQKQQPVWKEGFPVTAAVFEFENTNENGPPNFSVKLTRSFRRDEDSDWESSEYLGGTDLLRGAKLLEAADQYVQSRLEEHYRNRKSERSQG